MRQDTEAVIVESVNAESGAAKAGMMAGDTIVKIGDATIANARELRRAMGGQKAGGTVDVVILRDGMEKTLQVQLGSN